MKGIFQNIVLRLHMVKYLGIPIYKSIFDLNILIVLERLIGLTEE